MNKKFQSKLEAFLHKFRVMSNDEFLEAVPDIQDEICDLWDEYRKMKEKSGPAIVTIEGGVAQFGDMPKGFVTGLEIWDFDIEGEEGWDDTEENEFGDKFQRIVFDFPDSEKEENENN